ncbi:MAG TPA: HAMP domain-containing protein, partial [Chloroflexota bacterium]|nr:HAMP domain-containing protein [Chloroflexota bacterium]
MIRSIRLRLLLAFMLVLGVALSGMSVLTSRSTATEFHGFMENRSANNFRRVMEGIVRYYGDNQGWTGIQGFVERTSQLTGDHIMVADNSGSIVADSDSAMVGQPANQPAGVPVIVAGTQVGTAYVNPGQSTPQLPPPEKGPPPEIAAAAFVSSVNRSILMSAVAAALLALLLTVILSRRILRPVEALTSAARAMEKGDLAQRVTIKTHDEVGDLAEAFNSMAESLAKTERLRQNMVTDVAHE